MQINDYNLIGGITVDQIIHSIPMFDAMTPEFWAYANEYIPKDILDDETENAKILEALNTNIWFRNKQTFSVENNAIQLEFEKNDESVSHISISYNKNNIFLIKNNY
jgi:hypothetical protein